MIKLNKQPEPNILTRNKAKWTADLMSCIDANQKVPDNIKNLYNHPDIKSVLRTETNGGKCMYCESPIAAVAAEHIEHYKPKAAYPSLTFEWNNLGLSCPKCNINKGHVFDENNTYINPYIDFPSDHFIFLGTMILSSSNNRRAQITEFKLDLNRSELLEARKNRIDTIRLLIDKYETESDSTLKTILKNNIVKEIAEDKPYSMCAKMFCQMMIRSEL